MLEIADKLGSVLSALIALVGLVLTVYGLRLQRRATRPTAPPPPSAPTGPPQPDPARLEIPDRSAWVPSPEYLPPGSANQGFGHPPMQRPHAPAPTALRRTVLVIGLVLLAVAIALGVATWLL
ncbi:hypothetical protein [Saccharopolyspora shandongensis]|uniref:hypothetical protein n=1 Tax=Saccharopolyspora shandongensis TaxID=418495 RepID=UPI0033CA653E